MTTKRPPRQERTPSTDAHWLMTAAIALWARRARKSPAFIHDTYVAPMMADPAISGYEVLQRLKGRDDKTILHMLTAVCAFTIEAARAGIDGDPDRSWAHLCDAHRWFGSVQTLAFAVDRLPSRKSVTKRQESAATWLSDFKTWAVGKLDDYGSVTELAEDAITAGIVTGKDKKTIANQVPKLFPGWHPKGTRK